MTVQKKNSISGLSVQKKRKNNILYYKLTSKNVMKTFFEVFLYEN